MVSIETDEEENISKTSCVIPFRQASHRKDDCQSATM
eukprot:CAMPEP_0195017530 /NCGR_PEP_ID=MMETSP0326_2-20130528/27758_1 /TAXON_ID=2866 ORGANISM="Crypthecodinium cohnii, Strain Seligo" /NCGR_SAMPLE_ID=MMETSP0326_2 /ASSEMBLY_ACC=CAM_ASM_000348 /LENGTH=36 /DNA_ID= /DNA_START= /DNA_END= /DNA_ORIENTATION=